MGTTMDGQLIPSASSSSSTFTYPCFSNFFQFVWTSSTSTTIMFMITTILLMMVLMDKVIRMVKKRLNKNYPPSPSSLPLIGHLHHMSEYHNNPWDGFDSFRKKFGDVVQLQLGSWKTILISSPEIMREVLMTKGEIFADRPNFKRYHVIFLGDRENSLALCNWSELQRMRRIVATAGILPRFGSGLFNHLNRCIQLEITSVLMPESLMKFSRKLTKTQILFFCGNVFTNYLCSRRFEFGEDPEYLKILYNYDWIFYDINQCYSVDFLPWMTTYFGIGSSYYRQIVQICQSVRKYMETNVIKPRLIEYQKKRRDLNQGEGDHPLEHETNDNDHTIHQDQGKTSHDEASSFDENDWREGRDFLDLSIEHHLKNPTAYPWDVSVFEVMDLIGGSSAVGNLLYRLLGHLAVNPDIQDDIRKEAEAALSPDSGGVINLDQRSKMPLTESCILETLRIASSPIVPHVAVKDSTVGGFDVDGGTMVMFNTYHLNMSSKYWVNPQKFNPKRFLVKSGSRDQKTQSNSEERTENNNQNDDEDDVLGESWQILKPDHFFPFSCGRRACLGYKMVTYISFCAVANLCYKFKIGSNDLIQIEKDLTPKGSLALSPDNSYELTLTPRI